MGKNTTKTETPDESNPSNKVTSAPTSSPTTLSKWSWGGFVLNWIWGVCNGVYWPLVIIPIALLILIAIFHENGILLIIAILPIIGISIYLGFKGNKLAWNGKKKWADSHSFENIQWKWASAAKIVAIVYLILFLVVLIRSMS